MGDGRPGSVKKKQRAFFLKQLYQWHWISSGLCLVGMVLFALTGITLNHAGQIEASPAVASREASCRRHMSQPLAQQPAVTKAPLPDATSAWLKREMGVERQERETEWSAREVYVALPRPGGDAWMSIDRDSGGRPMKSPTAAGSPISTTCTRAATPAPAWSWFIDLFAVAAIDLLPDRPAAAAAARQQTSGDLAGGRPWLRHSGAARRSFHSPLKVVDALSAHGRPHHPRRRPAVASEATISIEIPRLNVAEYHRPYVAFWLENADGSKITNLAVWYDVKLKDNEGTKWLKDMRQWWRRTGPRTDDAGRWPEQPDPRARHPSDHQFDSNAKPLNGSDARQLSASSSRPPAKSAGVSCCAFRSNGRRKRRRRSTPRARPNSAPSQLKLTP